MGVRENKFYSSWLEGLGFGVSGLGFRVLGFRFRGVRV